MEVVSSDDDDDDSFFDTVMIVCQEAYSDSSSDSEEETASFVWGGSTEGRASNIERHRVFYSHLLFKDFWGPTPVYSHNYFKLFFKLPIKLFDEILVRVLQHDDYFRQKKDAAGKIGLSTHQKVASAVRLLTSGVSSMEHDDKYRMAASTALESMKRFCVAVNELYEADALRHPTVDDINRLLDEGKDAGFPGCIGSIDCMHWEWKNCPSSWKGMFQGKSGRPTVVLEAIADHTCRFWHFNFGSPGSLNDINILDRSPLFHNAVKGEAPQVAYTVNGNHYRYAYWLADGIYSNYACFVKTFPRPTTRMQKMFATAQEAKRKDIERAFGILQARFHVLTSGCRLWNRDAMKTVIKTCVILHNLIIDFERVNNINPTYIAGVEYIPTHPFTIIPRTEGQVAEDRTNMIAEMKDVNQHNRLQHDLMVEMWDRWNNTMLNDEQQGRGNESDASGENFVDV